MQRAPSIYCLDVSFLLIATRSPLHVLRDVAPLLDRIYLYTVHLRLSQRVRPLGHGFSLSSRCLLVKVIVRARSEGWKIDTSFNNSILLTDFSATESAAFRSLANSKGMAYVNLTTLPPASERTAPAVIQIPYTCNVRKRKPLASLVVSVISATLSMFLGARAAVLAVLSRIAWRTPAGNTCDSLIPSAGSSGINHRADAQPLMREYPRRMSSSWSNTTP
ncbi:hypothetical protein B0H13DRAFT_1853775 [Mycena leptocephala]|nr:hypothetical protein B0H13DRAFT_1853775 [Mycena leptocephala]